MRTAIFNSETFPNAHNISVCNSHNVIQIATCTDLVKHLRCFVWTGQNLAKKKKKQKKTQKGKGQNSLFFCINNRLVWSLCTPFVFTTFWLYLWIITEQTYTTMECLCFIWYRNELLLMVTSSMHLPSNRSQLRTSQNVCTTKLKTHLAEMIQSNCFPLWRVLHLVIVIVTSILKCSKAIKQ